MTGVTNLSINIVNINGALIYEQHDRFWDRDGPAAKFLDDSAWTAWAVAGIHALAGNGDYAQAALAHWANSAIVNTAVAIGGAVGGPAASVLMAGLMTPFGKFLENGLADAMVDNPRLLSEFEEATFGGIVADSITNAVGKLAGQQTGKPISDWLNKVGRPYVERTGSEIATKLYEKATGQVGNKIGGGVAKKLLDNITDGLDGKSVPEWDSARQEYSNEFIHAQ